MTDGIEMTGVYGANALYIAEAYERWLQHPDSVDASWQAFFAGLGDNADALIGDFGGASWAREKSQVIGYAPPVKADGKAAKAAEQAEDASSESIRAHMLIRAYRVRGHLIANLDPLGIEQRESHPELDPAHYGFTEDDYDHPIYIGGWLGMEQATLREILAVLKETYSSTLAAEFIHIQSLEKKQWLEEALESTRSKPSLSAEQKKDILRQLVEVVGFEEFLHIKYPGAKRFSVEGGENLLPAMEAVLSASASLGVNEAVIGMPHRGRLNVLTAFMKKPYAAMLSEFEGNLATPDYIESSGDVKYHLGISSDREFPGGQMVHLSLNANPSHLEAVNPVVSGKVRAKQDQKGDPERSQTMGIVLHGDAAFCGQGVVAETLMLSDLEGYKTGGTVQIVVNNQVGFTARPHEGHKSPYPTDVAMMIQAPIFHVNGDDPEAVVHASQIAAEYRHKFNKDVVIDLFCYRKHGHNEGDEPMFTHPIMYKKIADKPTPREVYAERLIAEGVISEDEYAAMKKEFHDYLDKEHKASKNYKPNKADWLEGKWQGLKQAKRGTKPKVETAVKLATLKKLGKKLAEVPEGFNLNRKVGRMLEAKKGMIESGKGIDWATAEALAFASLLAEGHPVRLSGQDAERGTFSHRHSVFIDQETEAKHLPLNHVANKQAEYEVINSNLSEYAVLGFEYGYSSAEPNALTLWEAQFGDFVNGAQIMIDQFICSAEHKWLRMSGLVMLLPHGYEGQGPEHSSARLERFLQLCAEDNWQVANCTTPANYFHILRRQLKRDFRKPLVLMAPKSLLRHKRAQSTLKELAEGSTFHRVLPEQAKLTANAVKRVVICSGKVYYDLLEAREERGIKDVALLRLEQFYPFPDSSLVKEIKKYPNADCVWCQEEPQNMGGWSFVQPRLEALLEQAKAKVTRPVYAGRPEAASPAAGYMKLHTQEQQALIDAALTVAAAKKKRKAG